MSNASTSTTHRFAFHGTGGNLFGQFLVNWLLTVITLGIYYPWAKAKLTRYYYQHTELAGQNFEFHGTGMEMFIGFLKTVLILAGIGVTAYLVNLAAGPVAAVIAFYLILIALIPFAAVESLRYTCSRSSWRNVHFSYDGTASNMAAVYFPGVLLTIITFGIYSSWLMVALERERTNNTRFGDNVTFEYDGNGADLFKKILVGYLLSIVTLGIYSFWLMADLYNYSHNHTYVHQNGRGAKFVATVTGGGLLAMFVVDLFLLVVSLGFASPWIVAKNLKYVAENLYIEGDLDLDAVQAGKVTYATATGEELTAVLS